MIQVHRGHALDETLLPVIVLEHRGPSYASYGIIVVLHYTVGAIKSEPYHTRYQ